MFGKQQTLEVSAQEISVMEAALHTQSKILHVQAGAGDAAAVAQLNVVKQVLARIAQQKPSTPEPTGRVGFPWCGLSRIAG
ncbi:hypothetical protein [Sulfitobacter geojensis]|uniref:Uncharacterized protein n=1 Tax=Sulfitobacter geojensis TaxID=1342299 RepID=A0AAE3B4K5_9RHOB|nr:hypothetical protein [Sulfitobacter geojensis]KHA53045.1 hypothetical protein Z947_3356 [Sulfitobacter geojensis]MBM1687633.1 hypothetical protein [Sulfitobacter geojensis]MBM1691700.1 hypothetical protein [Sulfitobacter geojensis]MBM1703866.1 hypothetical protein [Sulfitobacter geojensis]MBM1707924.1 hypothetical protein [Sulfitobacter geojensis]